ncbi:shikimate 5-dehydrogenase [Metapseudomonas furukawaii]|uniref:Shikimate 5-dehydrogenase I gamma n=1 Tax=Metapseudomonas furukawaii TaxID=1149133 RepID=A0AAD1C4A3_METFU|nr:shikimate 5-dehydrogenase [Pseudomonas furukawaii]ELS25994.1 Shikimate 5-dehydrogenase I gamma [Pseudomonas furukawaii]BAU75858.1 shikimate 5-dehydrogenase I gamma [Pseudomonas furukawaii]
MPRTISRDTRLCMSLSGRPGNFGTRFQNYLYQALDLDFVYKAFTTTDLPAAIGGIRALGIRGSAVSMPFKEACIPLLDELDASARAIDSVNTIVAESGWLKGYNTDYSAVASLLASHGVPRDITFALRGSGGMAKAVASAFRDSGFRQGRIVARNATAGPALAEACGYAWRDSLGDERPGMLVNVTPLGMEGGADAATLAFTPEQVVAADWVFDVVALPVETPLIRLARAHGKRVITGAEVIVLQAVEQFVLYTGVRPEAGLIEEAAAFARGMDQ